MIKRLSFIALVSTLFMILLSPHSLATPVAPNISPINVLDKNEVKNKYNQYINQPYQASNWSGSYSTCDRGSISDAYVEQGLGVLNWYRAMMGLTSAIYDSAQSYQTQGRALTMAANRYIGHTLTPDMRCYSSNGSVPSKGQYEVMASYGLKDAFHEWTYEEVIASWGLAHRDFIFYKGQPKVGVGYAGYSAASLSGNTGVNTAPSSSSGSFSIGNANVLAFPGRGYYPYQAVNSLWSIKLEAPGAGATYDLSQASATVKATRDNVTQDCNIKTGYVSGQLVLYMKHGDCHVFVEPNNCIDGHERPEHFTTTEINYGYSCYHPFESSYWTFLRGDTRYDITVRGAKTNTGASIPEFSYYTTLFDPNPPVIPSLSIGLSNSSVAENSPVDTVIGKLSGHQGNYSYYTFDDTVVGAVDNKKLKIVRVDIDPSPTVTNYEYRLAVREGIDYESTNQLKVGIRLSDRRGVGKTQLFTINVSNVNEPATKVVLNNTNTFTSAIPANTSLGTITVIDPEVNQTHTITLVSGQGNNNLFTISGGQLKNVATLAKGTYTIVFRVKDNGIPAQTVDLTMTYRVGLYPVYRFYNFKTGAHFYTTNEAERDKVINTLSYTFVYENIAYYVDALNNGNCNNGLSKVYRFYNFKTGAHFYTTNEAERDKVINTLAYTFAYEGPRYCLSLTQTSTFNRPIYRFYRFDKGFHFYTANEAERDKVRNTLSNYYTYEGLRFYGAYDN